MQIYDIRIDKNYKETTRHGTYDYPLAIYETQLDKNILRYVNWHWHEEIQLMYVTYGSIKAFVDKETFILGEGDGLFVNSGVLHKFIPDGIPDSRFVAVNAHEKLLSGFTGSRIGRRYVLPFMQNDSFPYCRIEDTALLSEINDLFNDKPEMWELELQIKLLQFWSDLIKSAPIAAGKANSSRDAERLKHMLQIVSERYGEKLTLDDFSRSLHLSSAECCRLFKRQMHCTLFDFITDYRIEKSLHALQHSDTAISTIAYDCGFASTSYYIKRFREKTGMTPLEFRKLKMAES